MPSSPPANQQTTHRVSKPKRKKLSRLPANAQIHKRPLLHPAIPSPYSGTTQQKVIYITAKTPFLSAVKRAEKLLKQSDKRAVQSATTQAGKQRQSQYRGKNRRKSGSATDEAGDEILAIAETLERQKGGGEEVLLKGTGKAVQKVLELGLWFQERGDVYIVKLKTGSVGAIDDIALVEEADVAASRDVDGSGGVDGEAEDGAGKGEEDRDAMDVDSIEAPEQRDELTKALDDGPKPAGIKRVVQDIPETRIRYVSSLEVAVSLR
ncbi:hypothetical protein LTR37_017647 [Vermiconidia calcicola]|uniref:Uncharacterized protein n=1 Tax=Vermiconidia calcicola TaxID=1690605 RepID=A0ACC3MJC6_9PEZI|nr:hypothetical protein LTR37_017647 [Vermiconidia calcicola]